MAFQAADLEDYVARSSFTAETKKFVREAARSLSRDVGRGSYKSVVTEMQSDKMGTTVNTESRRGEFAYAVHLEFDDDVLGYYEQLPPVDCQRINKNGNPVMRAYRADFLVLYKQDCRVIEVKKQNTIEKLVTEHPDDWIIRDGVAVDLPAEKAFGKIGLKHQVVSSADLPAI